MKKDYFKFLSVLVMVCCISISFSACGDDEDDIDDGGNMKSSLTVDGKFVEITNLEAEYEDGVFSFWVNDVTTTNKGIYIQADFSAKENISTEMDITSKFNILFQRNSGNEWFVGDGNKQSGVIPEYNSYRSGNIIVKHTDVNKKILTIEFRNSKYLSNLKNLIVINGTLVMSYKVI